MSSAGFFLDGVTQVVVLDFETYYDKEFSLSKLTTEEYVRDDRFETIGVSLQNFLPDGTKVTEPTWFAGDDAREALSKVDWDTTCAVAHNMAFDGFILSQRYGIVPKQYACTLNLSRPWFGLEVGGSLKAIAKRLNMGVKGTEVENALGKHLEDFTPDQLARYADYCNNDVQLTSDIFWWLLENVKTEPYTVDLHQRMANDPVLEIDIPLLQDTLRELREDKREILREALLTAVQRSDKLAKKIKQMAEKGEPATKLLSSNPMFKEIIEAFGYTCPMKTSPTTGKQIPAFGKKDPEFMAFESATAFDKQLQVLIAARKKTKSTLMESRIERFTGVGTRGPLPIPLTYWGAATGRASGRDKINLQNMPRGSALRRSIMAPKGHTLVVADSGQIEARGVGWVAKEQELLDTFARGDDVYCWMASRIYGRNITKADKTERQVGKIAVLGLGYGMGAAKYQDTLRAMTGVELTLDEAKQVVDIYRKANHRISTYWRLCDEGIQAVAAGSVFELGPTSTCPLTFHPAEGDEPVRIDLPNGMQLRYNGFHYNAEMQQFAYYQQKGRTKVLKPLWGGIITENIVQALARIVVFDQMEAVDRALRPLDGQRGHRFKTVLTVHDEIVVTVPESMGNTVLDLMLKAMKTPPAWAQGWPLDAEGDIAKRYGDAK